MIVAIIQARTGSKRLPRKILKKLGRKSIISIIIDKLKNVERIDKIILATTKKKN